jgi:AcrR family transcriptional regulator
MDMDSNLEEKKQVILRSAIYVFSVHGKDKASLSLIARHALVSKPLLFHYFSNKEDLLEKTLSFATQLLQSLHATNEDAHMPFFDYFYQVQLKKLTLESSYPGLMKFMFQFTPFPLVLSDYPFNDFDRLAFKPHIQPQDVYKQLYFLSVAHATLLEKGLSFKDVFASFQQAFAFIKALTLKEEHA